MTRVIHIGELDGEDLEDVADEVQRDFEPRGRGGGTRRKREGSDTPGEAWSKSVEDSQGNRREKYSNQLAAQLEHFPKEGTPENREEHKGVYRKWLNGSFIAGYAMVDPGADIKFTFSKPRGAGGQHKDKGLSAATCIHLITGIFSYSAGQREQDKNKEEAFSGLLSKLDAHLKTWREYLKTFPAAEQSKALDDLADTLL